MIPRYEEEKDERRFGGSGGVEFVAN